jgi:hypothetical protein
MTKITEMVVSLLRETMAKTYRRSGGRTKPWWRLAAFFLKRVVSYLLVNTAFKFSTNTLKINGCIAFVTKKLSKGKNFHVPF